MATEAEIAWAAGLFEGEGCLRVSRNRRGNLSPMICLQMTDRDMVQRFKDILEGRGDVRGPWDKGPGRKPMYAVDICGRTDVKRVMQSFLPWLGTRRTAKAIEVLALIDTLDAAAAQRAKHCPHGHLRSPENTYVNPKGYGICLTCKRANAREWAKHKYATNPVYAQQQRDASREDARRMRADPILRERRNARRRKSWHRKQDGAKLENSQLEIGFGPSTPQGS